MSERRSELLYDAVALGMSAYVRSAFRPRALGVDRVRIEAGMLLVSTHRSDADVPLVCSVAFLHAGVWSQHRWRVHFAARDDLFEPGVLAGIVPGLPPGVRRLLWPVSAARGLPLVRVYPIRSATRMKVVQALRSLPAETPLDDVLPGPYLERLRARAADAGVPAPRTAADALRGELADLLWQAVGPGELSGPAADLWHAWRARAIADVRGLVALIRAGHPLLLFPEGVPSPDGAIGPLRPGLAALVRRGQPGSIVPLGIAWDPLTPGRPYAYLAFGEAFAPEGDVEEAVLAALRLATPLTCGQVVAHRLVEAGTELSVSALDDALSGELEEARLAGRRFDPALARPAERRRRVAEALAATAKAPPETLARLAREYASARGKELSLA